MKNHENEIIGVLQLINATDIESGSVRPFSDADQRLAESLASQAAIALTNSYLVGQLEALFESFITPSSTSRLMRSLLIPESIVSVFLL